ncbi:MAG: hypothetical protein ABI423_10075 [Burkholderiales bacterium]
MRSLLALLLLAAPLQCAAQSRAWDDGSVPFIVSPPEIVERMLRMAGVGSGDTLIDLGSGDGRIVIAAAKRGARAWNHLFAGRIEGGRIAGELAVSDAEHTRSYPWTATRAQ